MDQGKTREDFMAAAVYARELAGGNGKLGRGRLLISTTTRMTRRRLNWPGRRTTDLFSKHLGG